MHHHPLLPSLWWKSLITPLPSSMILFRQIICHCSKFTMLQFPKKKKKKKALPLFPKAAPMPLVSLGAKDRAELSHPILLDAALSH